jgi:hypothetical protein
MFPKKKYGSKKSMFGKNKKAAGNRSVVKKKKGKVRYEGEWQNGKMNGRGTAEYPNGDCYIGEWKDGKWHGRGTFSQKAGDRYDGEFKNGLYDGNGTYYHRSGKRDAGWWQKGVFVGAAPILMK